MAANGHIPLTELVEVEGQYLAPQTARAYLSLMAAAKRAGHEGSIWKPAGAYRSEALQRDMIANPAKYNVKAGVSLAPVGQSTHGLGRTVDIHMKTAAGRAWVAANAAAHGLRRPNPVNDPDHYEHGTNVATVAETATQSAPKGEDMKYIYKEEGGVAWALLDSHLPNGYIQTTSVAEAEKYARLSPQPAVLVSAANFSASLSAAEWYKGLIPAPGSGGLADADIVDEAELGQALTAAVNLVNEHTDAKFAALTLHT